MTVLPLKKASEKAAAAQRRAIRKKHKGKAPNVLTPLEKDEIMLAMAESLGFYDPTP